MVTRRAEDVRHETASPVTPPVTSRGDAGRGSLPVAVEVVAASVLSYAMAHNRVPVIGRVT